MGTIRLLLALAVLLVMHSTPIFGLPMIGAAGAVQGFYVISGFYMALVLNEKYPRGVQGYGEFISQRLLRLLPAYWVCLLGSIILGWTGLGTILPKAGTIGPFDFWRTHAGTLPGYQLAYLIFNQTFLLGQDWMLFINIGAGGLHFIADYMKASPGDQPAYLFLFVGPAWSLGLELTFYLVAPFIVRRRWWVMAAVAIASTFILRVLVAKMLVKQGIAPGLLNALGKDPWCYRFFPTELGTFLLGSLGYHFYALARTRKWDLSRLGWVAWIVLLLAIFILPMHSLDRVLKGIRPPFFYFLTAACVPFIFALTKNWKIDRWIGELSYPVYIVHFVVGAAMARAMGATGQDDIKGWQLLLASLPIAILIRICVEQPIDRMRARMHEKRTHRREKPEVLSPAPM